MPRSATVSRKTLRPLFDPPTQEEIEAEKRRLAEERAAAAARRLANRAATHTGRAVKRLGLTIDEFAFAHGFSRAHYYNLKKRGLGPDETRLIKKIIITDEAGARWRKRNTAT
jgi:hypothetical protein